MDTSGGGGGGSTIDGPVGAAGGARFAAYPAGPNKAAREEVELVAALRAETLDVHSQPRIDARYDRWSGMEALVRWHNPQRGVDPAVAVPSGTG